MNSKWDKLRILIEWLEQGRTLELEGDSYGISESGDILHMYCEDKGVPIPTLYHIFKLVDKIDDNKIFSMSGEIVMTEISREKANKRAKNITLK